MEFLTIAVCTSAGIGPLLKYRAEVGTQTNGGLEEYREVRLEQRRVYFCLGEERGLPAEHYSEKLYRNLAQSCFFLVFFF